MQTRKNEHRYTTSDPREMLGKYVAQTVSRKWNEDFVDEGTGEVVSIGRSEWVASRGAWIDQDLLSKITFHLQAGDIQEVEVSNQKRDAYLSISPYLSMWVVTAGIDSKNVKFLLYANSITMAIEILEDYVELHYSGGFTLVGAKHHSATAFIKDGLSAEEQEQGENPEENPAEDQPQQEDLQFEEELPVEEEPLFEEEDQSGESANKKFYNIEVYAMIKVDGEEQGANTYGNFIVEATDIDRSLILIRDYIRKRALETLPGLTMSSLLDISLKLETAKFFQCKVIIDKEFSMEYREDSEGVECLK